MVVLADEGASRLWSVPLRDQDMPSELLLCVAFPPCQASEDLALHALHPTAETSYHVSFFMRREWSQSSHPVVDGKLEGIFVQVAFLVQHEGNPHFQDMSPPRFSWS